MSETLAQNPGSEKAGNEMVLFFKDRGRQADLYARLDGEGRSEYLGIRLRTNYVAHEIAVTITVEKLGVRYKVMVEKSVVNKLDYSVRDVINARYYTVDDRYVVVTRSVLERVKSFDDVLEIARQVHEEVQRITMSALSPI
jgi:hypothetical protein